MMNPKFRLKEDWYIETSFLGTINKELIFKKDHIFESDNNIYIIKYNDKKIELLLDDMRKNSIFEEILEKENLKLTIEEFFDDADVNEEVKNWRIQLDVRTTSSKLKEFEKIFRESAEYIK